MVKKNDIAILIQGPLNPISLDYMADYEAFCSELIISYWEDSKTLLPDNLPNYVKTTKEPLPDVNKTQGIVLDNTFYYALKSTCNGIKECTKEFIIKTRSDEVFSDLTPLIEQFDKNLDKMVYGNNFAKPMKDSYYHIGDHLFICRTKVLLDAYIRMLDMYEKRTELAEWADQYKYTPESILAKSFSLSAKNRIEEADFKNLFDLVDVNILGKFIVSWQHNNILYSNREKEVACKYLRDKDTEFHSRFYHPEIVFTFEDIF